MVGSEHTTVRIEAVVMDSDDTLRVHVLSCSCVVDVGWVLPSSVHTCVYISGHSFGRRKFCLLNLKSLR